MWQMKVVAVGRVREKYLQTGILAYVKRLAAYANINILEVADEPCPERLSAAEEEQVKRKEGERILKVLSPQDQVILLDIQGRQMDSSAVARWLEDIGSEEKPSLAFVIGGSLGVSPLVHERANFIWSFSALTFPHPLMRLLLLAQLHRVLKLDEDARR